GTCAIETAAQPGVVGPDLRVKGVAGLRVADASVMPRIPTGNTNWPAIMVGEHAAHLIKIGEDPAAGERGLARTTGCCV
ncbi:GMC oxidoreductase-domain-containing protein, partial [Pavlovales sp. CCMP2436]